MAFFFFGGGFLTLVNQTDLILLVSVVLSWLIMMSIR